jgi:ribosomal protein L11 methyltransferase
MIDWEEQWSLFAHDFRDGMAHIPVGGKLLRLLPGPGFGDCSHPTTQLMLELMVGEVEGKEVLDVGCGSGILTLASLFMGAKRAEGVDIEEEAIWHAKKNRDLNGLECEFRNKISYVKPEIVLMNMIAPEQKQIALPQSDRYITSGILVEQEEAYLSWMGREVKKRRVRGEWVGYVFSARPAM